MTVYSYPISLEGRDQPQKRPIEDLTSSPFGSAMDAQLLDQGIQRQLGRNGVAVGLLSCCVGQRPEKLNPLQQQHGAIMKQQDQIDGVAPEAQVISAKELADMVKLLRGARNWSQEQLAEISGLTVRTIQRVERGETSNFDTRRALARAFEAPDIDCFNNPFVRITPEHAKSMAEKFKRDHLFLPAEAGTGNALVKLAEVAGMDMSHSAAEMPRQAEEAFAMLIDYWREFRDAQDCYNAVSKLDVRDDLQGYLDELDRHGFSVRIADRPIAVGLGEKAKGSYRTRICYIVAFTKGKEPKELVVAKTVQF